MGGRLDRLLMRSRPINPSAMLGAPSTTKEPMTTLIPRRKGKRPCKVAKPRIATESAHKLSAAEPVIMLAMETIDDWTGASSNGSNKLVSIRIALLTLPP